MNLSPRTMRRWQEHTPPLQAMPLALDHPAVVTGHTKYLARVRHPYDAPRLLKRGHHNRKIGDRVTKGAWKGMRIYTLTLEERATCPTSCDHWRSCYGNAMNWPERLTAGPALESRLDHELAQLQRRHPGGFVVRLHVLGDFYSVAYVERWLGWLDRFPALRVYGYTARQLSDPIGGLLHQASAARWDRFAVRLSNGAAEERGANTVYRMPSEPRVAEGIVCPAQTGRTDCCGTCGLCWGTRANIAFVAH